MFYRLIGIALCGGLAACSATPIHLPLDEMGPAADSGGPDSFRGWDMFAGGLDSDLEDNLHVDSELGTTPPESDAAADDADGAGDGYLDGAGEAGPDGGDDGGDAAEDDSSPPDAPPDLAGTDDLATPEG